MSFGSHDLVSLIEAREKRDAARKQIINGIDPVVERKIRKIAQKLSAENSLETVSREWHATKVDRWTLAYREEIIKTFEQDIFPFIGKRLIAKIKLLELFKVLRRIEECGTLGKTKKVRQRCEEVLRYATITDRAEYNPASDLTIALTVPKRKHHLFLPTKELPRFIRDLEVYTGNIITENTIKIVMLTGVGTREMHFATWDGTDLQKKVWGIPIERIKVRRPHLVPFSTQVVEIFQQLKLITRNYPYIFVGRNNHTELISRESISQVIELLDYKGRATGHGFRRTVSAILHEYGFSNGWMKLQLAHVDRDSIRGTYNHAQYLEKRSSTM